MLGLALAGERGGPNDESIEHLTKQAALQSLVIEDCRSITDAGLGELASLTSLRRLELGATRRATAAGLVSLWKLTGLEVLCLHLPSEDRDGSVAGAFKGVKSLAN